MNLIDAANDLVSPIRSKHGGVWYTEPSLLDQLRDAVARVAAGGAAGKAVSIPIPISASVLDLLNEIEGECRGRLRRAGQPMPPGVPLRDLVLRVTSLCADRPADWLDQLGTWVSSARAVLATGPELPRALRSTPCPSCGADRVLAHDGVEMVQHPPLQLHWAELRDSSGDVGHRLRAISCRGCRRVWWAGEGVEELARSIGVEDSVMV